MNFVLFVFYALLFSILIYKYRVYSYFKLTPAFVLLLFWLKVFAGFLYLYIHQRYYGGGDTVAYQRDGSIVYHTLFSEPKAFFKIMLLPNLESINIQLFPIVKHLRFWFDNGSFLVVKMLVVFNLFTFGNIWLNTIFFELFTMIGLLSLYKVFANYFSDKKPLLLIALFAIPSTLFWSSGINKDGLILTCIGVLFMCLNDLVTKKIHLLKIFLSIISVLILLAIRGYEIVLMIPGLVALYWVYKQPSYKFFKFLGCYIFCIALFFFIENQFNLGYLNFILQKQQRFIVHGLGNSMLRPLMITPNWQSFVLTAPHALYRTLLRPNIFQFSSWHEMGYAIIHSCYLLICVALLSMHFLFRKPISGLALFCLFYAISLFVFIGWIVPNVGAMVRYSSCAYVFFTLFFVLIVDEKKFSFLSKFKNIFKL